MKKTIFIVSVFWLVIVASSFTWNLLDSIKQYEKLANETSKAFFDQIVITRAWNAMHKGVYVPITKDTLPNPYLEDPLRDLVTTDGLKLTKINPAYMTRQIAELAMKEKGTQFHITSLNPIRKENKASEWETVWLNQFEKDTKSLSAFFEDDNHTSFRYMAPLMVKDVCLKCHAKQGYKKGDVRGGISITMPHMKSPSHTFLILGYGIAGSGGLLLIVIGGTMIGKRNNIILKSNDSLKTEITQKEQLINDLEEAILKIKQLSGIVPICMYCKEIRDDKGYWNQLEQFISKHSETQFSHSICPKCMAEKFPDDEDDEEK